MEHHPHEDYVEAVLRVVESIPAGRVLTYGDVAEIVGRGGPRQVGRVMATMGDLVPWWRVIRASGEPALGHERRALEHFREEGTPLRPDGVRVDLRGGRWTGRPE